MLKARVLKSAANGSVEFCMGFLFYFFALCFLISFVKWITIHCSFKRKSLFIPFSPRTKRLSILAFVLNAKLLKTPCVGTTAKTWLFYFQYLKRYKRNSTFRVKAICLETLKFVHIISGSEEPIFSCGLISAYITYDKCFAFSICSFQCGTWTIMTRISFNIWTIPYIVSTIPYLSHVDVSFTTFTVVIPGVLMMVNILWSILPDNNVIDIWDG